MKHSYCRFFTIVALVLCSFAINAAELFKIKQFQVEGLQRISQNTVLSALPLQSGDYYHSDSASDIIQSLYQTGFFKNISVFKRQDIVIIRVQERPTVSKIKISGNTIASEEDLKKSLKSIGLTEGEFYDEAVFDGIIRSLKRQYFSRGNQHVSIDPVVTEISRNRVDIKINITEGKLARIDRIQIHGNEAFSTSEVKRQLPLAKSGLMTVFNSKDVYSEEALDNGLEALKTFYMNQGYVEFAIVDKKVTYATDNKYVRVDIHVKEGPRYRLNSWSLTGNIEKHRVKLESMMTLKSGQWFSRQDIMTNAGRINHYYGQLGFAMVKVDPVPKFDHVNHTVDIRYYIEEGAEISVRRINFSGNHKTQSNVLRRELRQMEGGLFNSDLVQASVRRIRLLGYTKNVDLKLNPVPGRADQVDLDYLINEAIKTGSLSAGLGFGSDNGVFGQAGFQQPNFLGSGKTFGLNLSINKSKTALSFNYDNPYFTDDGISSGISAYAQRIDAEKENITDYTISLYGLNYSLGIPISENDRLRLMFGYEYADLLVGNHPAPHIQYFIDNHGTRFNELQAQLSWIHNGYDRGMFPTKGYYHNASILTTLPVGLKHELNFFRAHYYGHAYVPIWRDFILSLRTELGFGDGYDDYDELPFFKNYFAGGSQSVRGYRYNSLGPNAINPRTASLDDETIGGNLLMMGSVALVIPPLHRDLRTSLFIDIGNVFNTNAYKFDHCKHPNGTAGLRTLCKGSECPSFTDCRDLVGTVKMSDLRSSIGVSFEWISPMGPMLISFATPLKSFKDDQKKGFQFSVGTIL